MTDWQLFQVFDDIIPEKLDENVKRRAKQRIRIEDISKLSKKDLEDIFIELLARKLNFH